MRLTTAIMAGVAEIPGVPETRTIAFDVLGRSVTMTAPAACIIPRTLAHGGLAAHEPETLACAVALCERRSGPFIDVGANVGIFSIVVAVALGRECHAFEPTPEIADVIVRAAEENRLPIRVHALALSDYRGTATLYLSAKSDSSNSLNRRFRAHRGTIQVPVAPLDDLAIDGAAVLKIDTESTEPGVLRGARGLIRSSRPSIICEALPGRTEAQLDQFLAEERYLAYHITPQAPWKPHARIEHDGSAHYNWLFAPSEPSAELWTRIEHWRLRLLGSVTGHAPAADSRQ